MPGSDDLASVMVSQPTGGMRHSMGKIISWSPDTFENVVLWNGLEITNMKIADPVGALSYTSDMWVSVIGIDSSGQEGVTQWVIWGRLIEPGASAATQALEFMRTQLAAQISAEIFAARIQSDFDPLVAERTSTEWGDPTNGVDPGPAVTVDVSPAGKALVMIGCNTISSSLDSASVLGYEGGTIGFSVSGDTTLTPDNNYIARTSVYKYASGSVTMADGVRVVSTVGIMVPVAVNPGSNTFTMKYAKSGSADLLVVDNRSLTVIAF
ncbi:hypothetical protein [Glycomyces sp. NPDC021274]|uniref:hypothetical protein n=1 Tax=Glycomyces sp. NPDC021274 TaxID=3155120 RepID=UPI0034057F40